METDATKWVENLIIIVQTFQGPDSTPHVNTNEKMAWMAGISEYYNKKKSTTLPPLIPLQKLFTKEGKLISIILLPARAARYHFS